MALPQVAIGGGLTTTDFTPRSRTLSPATTGGAILALKVIFKYLNFELFKIFFSMIKVLSVPVTLWARMAAFIDSVISDEF